VSRAEKAEVMVVTNDFPQLRYAIERELPAFQTVHQVKIAKVDLCKYLIGKE
jgi:hypothetical protein